MASSRETPAAKDRLTIEERPRFYPVAEPALNGREREYVLDCLDSSWISSKGVYIDRFEEIVAEFCGVRHAITCTNGTVALHLALLALGIGPDDEVIVPTLTYVATANAVRYCGATPVFVDSEPIAWNIDPTKIEAAISKRTKAIIVVHLYGHPAEMNMITSIARDHQLAVIEDAAEALGAKYHGRPVGSIGDVSTFSFFGNKIITTGEGGMVTTNRVDIAERVSMLKGQGQAPDRRYWFPIIGYNYRMTNIAAAIGLAQMERVDWHLASRRRVAEWYQAELSGFEPVSTQLELPGCLSVYWMNSILLHQDLGHVRDQVMQVLGRNGIETRPLFPPLHLLPPYLIPRANTEFPVATSLAARGFNVPSSAQLTQQDVSHIAKTIRRVVQDFAE